MNYRVTHQTVYEYEHPVSVSHHAARVQPRSTAAQRTDGWRLDIVPTPAVRTTRTDYFGNRVCFFTIQELHRGLEIVAESEVRLTPPVLPEPGKSPPWEEVAAALREPGSKEVLEAQQFAFESPHVRPSPELAELAAASFVAGRPLLAAMVDFNRRIHREFTFDPEATTVATPVETVLRERRGVCQDFTHLALGGLRSLGLAARYVSGYLRTYRTGGGPDLVGADASHAWLSVFCPRHGWVDFDPTNDLMPAAEHIAVAFGRDFSDVSPVTGMIVGGGEHTIRVAVAVEPV
ncbi:MAG: transglutaminase family protein [Verrucomicrobiae bacterium]|nr:transglutaminase family protein [Verrucomicrobiae bacterium]